MKFSISKEHSDFFRKNHAIEFEGLFSSTQISQLKNGIEEILARKLFVRPNHLIKSPPADLFRAGRDSWRENEGIKKILFHSPYLEIFSALTDQRTFRIGYDQYFPKPVVIHGENVHSSMLNKQATIDSVSSIQGLVGGAIICLEGSGTSDAIFRSFPLNEGHLVLFTPQAVIDFDQTLHRPDHSYLLVTFARENSVYIFNENDPNRNYLHSQGDRLEDKFNPIIFRG